jgi:hypothetical protein
MLVAMKTTRQRYHVYKHGKHNHAALKAKEEESDEGEEMEEEEEHEEEEEEETENGPIEHGDMAGGSLEVDGIEYPLEKCQCRLNSALQKGQMERAKKWMGRIDATKIAKVITEMDKINMTKLVGMANCDIRINKRR